MMSAKKLAFGFFGLVMIGSFGLVLFSSNPGMVTIANIGGLQFGTLTDPLVLGAELQGTFFAEEVLPLHQPALPFRHEFEGPVNQGLIEADASTRLTGESWIGEQRMSDENQAMRIEPSLVQQPDSTALTTAAESLAETQVHKEIMAEHRYLGSCDAY